MNYQPFYDMNILVSDSMLQVVQEHKLSLIFFAVLTFYLLFAFHLFIYSSYKLARHSKLKT